MTTESIEFKMCEGCEGCEVVEYPYQYNKQTIESEHLRQTNTNLYLFVEIMAVIMFITAAIISMFVSNPYSSLTSSIDMYSDSF